MNLEIAWTELTASFALLQSQVAQDLEELHEDVCATLGTFWEEIQEISMMFRGEMKELPNQVRVLFRSVRNEDQGSSRGCGQATK